MVRAWNENSFADSVLLICNTAAPASALIPGCGASAASAARPAGVSPISPKANSPKAVLAYRNVIMSLPPNVGHGTSRARPQAEVPGSAGSDAKPSPIGVHPFRLSGSAPFPPIFNEPEPLFVRVEEQVPKGAITENAPRLPEGKERDQRNKENGHVTQKAGQRAAQVGEGLR